jgi:demethylmenaquinone methyltransferase/2-methoxy-6-polyprenyl-1,4-benzoquinol methylase
MFDQIAHRYDLLNRVLTLGVDRAWRRRAVRELGAGANGTVLDLATGTGDIALLVARSSDSASVLGLDPSPKMLAIAEDKARDSKLDARVRFQLGDAQQLELPTASVDATIMAFGIRNVPDRLAALREMARVTRPGGRVAILELSEPGQGWLSEAARTYIHSIVPRLGALLSGAREYRYLAKSIAAFPPAPEFAALLREAGLRSVVAHELTFGVAHIYVGTVPSPAGTSES